MANFRKKKVQGLEARKIQAHEELCEVKEAECRLEIFEIEEKTLCDLQVLLWEELWKITR